MRTRGTAVVIKDGKVLMVRDKGKHRYSLPGGGINKNEPTVSAAAREVYEELDTFVANVIEKIGVSAGGYITNPKTGNIVDYAGHVEHGTSMSPAQPFLRPAFENKKAGLNQRLRHAIRRALMSY